jgi:hypothetical protein
MGTWFMLQLPEICSVFLFKSLKPDSAHEIGFAVLGIVDPFAMPSSDGHNHWREFQGQTCPAWASSAPLSKPPPVLLKMTVGMVSP